MPSDSTLTKAVKFIYFFHFVHILPINYQDISHSDCLMQAMSRFDEFRRAEQADKARLKLRRNG